MLRFNTKIQKFPTNVMAQRLGFKQHEYFEVEAESRENVQVSFGDTSATPPPAAPPAVPPATPTA